jgi:hypothetical protein
MFIYSVSASITIRFLYPTHTHTHLTRRYTLPALICKNIFFFFFIKDFSFAQQQTAENSCQLTVLVAPFYTVINAYVNVKMDC